VWPPSQRWSRPRRPVETSVARLQTTRHLQVLPGNTVSGVRKARGVLAIVDNPVRLAMGQAATLQRMSVERSSCLEALRGRSAPHPGRPRIAWIVLPPRPHRVEPRIQKRRAQSLPLMRTPGGTYLDR
jgi:hypothetical protein